MCNYWETGKQAFILVWSLYRFYKFLCFWGGRLGELREEGLTSLLKNLKSGIAAGKLELRPCLVQVQLILNVSGKNSSDE